MNNSKGMLNFVAKKFRGNSYSIDENVPFASLLGVASTRCTSILRCMARGIALKPSRLMFCGKNVVLKNRRMITIGAGVTLGNCVEIDGLSKCGVKLENSVTIGPGTIIQATGVISNLGHGLIVGHGSGIGAYSYIGAAGGVKIGANVIMGQYVSFHSENHIYSNCEALIKDQGVTRLGIVIHDDCWIGAKATILDGSDIGSGSVIAAGAVVKGCFPSGSVIGGVPAKLLKRRCL